MLSIGWLCTLKSQI